MHVGGKHDCKHVLRDPGDGAIGRHADADFSGRGVNISIISDVDALYLCPFTALTWPTNHPPRGPAKL
jgi:hypothetical protein